MAGDTWKTAEEVLAGPFGLLSDLIASHARARPNATAVVDGDRIVSYSTLNELVDRVAVALQRDGVQPTMAIAICAQDSLEYLATFLGALRIGVAVSPLAPSSTPQQLLMMLSDCAAQLFFLDQGTANSMASVTDQIPVRTIALDASSAGIAFETWLPEDGAKPQPVAIDPGWAFNIIYSSGTTGTPKGIVHSHAYRWVSIASASGLLRYGPDAVTMVPTPLYSNTTLGSVFATLGHGGALILMRRFDARSFLELAERHRATHAMLVPVQYRRIMAVPDFDQFDLSSFVMKFGSSAPFSTALKEDVLRRWPGGLIEFYGMTEGGGSFMLVAHDNPGKLHTVGCTPPGHDLRVIDENGVELPFGAVGEVVGRSPQMMTGYHNQPAKTASAEWYSPDGQRFIRTGDIGRFDEDGFFILMDRKKDMIISGGFNIYPSDIEAIIAQHPAVQEVAVVGMPSEAWGETPVAFVTSRENMRLSIPELTEFVAARVGKTQRPQAFEIVDALPRSAIGKVLKTELRDRFTGTVA
ncbi:class I adenylate-forming enzyme family protein [Flavisphingomonas formosensis]|uniref:class I adenylate-forming enzyme family protein n=1 Tax=Flavisphingomonas formosensis TaxID=861534 RepID=UPI0012F86616|nr:class I adenylate-forming enzyme family protein [Sphingomonas formosensis]